MQCTCMNFHEKILKLSKIIFFLVQMWNAMHLHEFSWTNIKTFKDHFFLVQMWYAMHCHALAWIFMKKYWTFKVHFFLGSDVRFNTLSGTCMNFHEKILKLSKIIFFLVEMWYAMHLHEFSWKNIETFKDHFFLSSDVICNALAWIFMKKYWNFQRSFFS
jgi:hypothetical protein